MLNIGQNAYIPFWVVQEYILPDGPILKCQIVSSYTKMMDTPDKLAVINMYTIKLSNGYDVQHIPEHALLNKEEAIIFATKMSQWFNDFSSRVS